MSGFKSWIFLCPIIILIIIPFGVYGDLLGVVNNTVQAATTLAGRCVVDTRALPIMYPNGTTAEDLLPNSLDLWTSLEEALALSVSRGPDYRSVPQMIQDDGYPVENHTIITDDGYILTYYRIPCGKNNCDSTSPRPPVFIQHGFLTYSACWIAVAEKDSLPYILADAGYDVWLGNARGTTPSQGHTNASISSAQYWSFDWEQMGTQDIPAAINYILRNTSFPQLYYVGHSMGTSMAFAGLSLKPDVSVKIRVFFALAPVAWLFKSTTALRLVAPAEVGFQALSYADILDQFPGPVNPPQVNAILERALQTLCDYSLLNSVVCANVGFLICGYDYRNTNFTALSELLGRFPNCFSLNTLRHFAQCMLRNTFSRFDFGLIENYIKYKQCTPPEYNVTAIRCKTFFFYGDSDAFSQIDDVMKLAGKFNQTLLTMHPMIPHWNHLDFLVANNARQYIADPIISYMKQNPI